MWQRRCAPEQELCEAHALGESRRDGLNHIVASIEGRQQREPPEVIGKALQLIVGHIQKHQRGGQGWQVLQCVLRADEPL